MAAIATPFTTGDEGGEPGRRSRTLVEVPDLHRNFVEEIVERARAIAIRDRPHDAPPLVDWESIWRAGDGAPSKERAIGCIITAALHAASEIAGGSHELLGLGHPHDGATSLPPPDDDAATNRPTLTLVMDGGVGGPARTIDAPRLVDAGTDVGNPPAHTDRVEPLTKKMMSPRRLVTGFTWVRNVGAILLLFVAWQLWGTSIAQHHAQHELQQQFETTVQKHHIASKSSTPVLVSADTPVAQPPSGSVVAELQVPAIGVDQYVVMGTSEAALAKGPGHYIGTAMPGQAGNVAIAGHRTTNGAPFNQLGHLVKGDDIYLTTTTGERLTYVVSQSPYPVSPSDTSVLDNFGDDRITLTTCNPEFSAAQRLIVIGELQGSKPQPVAKVKPIAYHVVNPATASWDWALLPLVALEGGVLVALGLANRRFTKWWGRDGRWFILVPLWTTMLYLFFGSLTSLLPGTY